ncbi:MAG: hypothetical protein AABZ02_09075 [Bacteroidota bacterium]
MRFSFNFILHLLGFGVLVTTLLAGFILDRKFRSEQNVDLKLYVGGIVRTIGLLSPLAAFILFTTGIGNIYNRYADSTTSWYQEGWLVAKIMVFVLMLLNGVIYGPKLSRSRMNLVKTMRDNTAPADPEKLLALINRQLTLFYLVQTVLLLLIIYLSVFGSAKHPGAF